MKKLWLLLPAVALLAAGCAYSPAKQTSQETTTPPANTATTSTESTKQAPGQMPAMTYNAASGDCGKTDEPGDVTLYADNKLIAIIKSPECIVDKVIFRNGNDKIVYFSVEPGGLGGYFIYQPIFNLYKLDLEKKTAQRIGTGDNWIMAASLNRDMTKLVYVTESVKFDERSKQVVIKNLVTGKETNYGYIPYSASKNAFRYQVGNVALSPDEAKLAIAVGYGPDEEFGEIYILDLSTKKYTLYKKVDADHVQVNGWKNNTEVDWSSIK